MTVLSVNLNKVALLRNQRDIDLPSVRRAAETCIAAGAGGITVHPRPDQRHVRPGDVTELSRLTRGRVEFNMEGNPYFEDFIDLVREVRPDQCTLVPDSVDQRTSDHGWDVESEAARLAPLVGRLRDLGIRVSLFMEPDSDQFAQASAMGADRVELYTERYARAFAAGDWRAVYNVYADAARRAQAAGLGVNAGHDLNLDNIAQFCTIPGILECSIGHALTAEALFLGLDATVRQYLARMRGAAGTA